MNVGVGDAAAAVADPVVAFPPGTGIEVSAGRRQGSL